MDHPTPTRLDDVFTVVDELGPAKVIHVSQRALRLHAVREDNAGRLKTRLVVQGANIPFTTGAEKMLHDRGVLVIPDFIANAGGVICAAMEYRGATQSAAFAAIEERTRANTKAVLDAMTARRVTPRQAALDLATARVEEAMSYRRFSIF